MRRYGSGISSDAVRPGFRANLAAMPRLLRHEVHPQNPQGRVLQHAVTRLREGAVLAVPSGQGYALVCRLDDKGASARLCRCCDPDERAPAALLCRDLAQAATYLHIDNQAFRAIRDADQRTKAFALRVTRRVPRRLVPAGGIGLLHFGGDPVLQGLLERLDEALLIGLPVGGALTVDDLPAHWLGLIDLALDAGPLPAARLAVVVDMEGLLRARPGLSRWAGAPLALI